MGVMITTSLAGIISYTLSSAELRKKGNVEMS